jgi:hypothetical protein
LWQAAEAEADAAEKANYTQTLKLLERLGLQSHIPTFMYDAWQLREHLQ